MAEENPTEKASGGAPSIVFFDLETQRSFDEVGGRKNLHWLGVSVAVTYNTATGEYRSYREADLPELVGELKSAGLVVGFNLRGFDYPVLQAYTKENLAELPTLDLLEDLKQHLGFRVGLDSVAEATLGARKSGHGLQAIRWFRQGEMDKLIAYCRDDVEITRRLFEFGCEKGYVSIFDRMLGMKRDVKVEWKRVLSER